MEPTSEPEHRQSRGLARFWPVHGTSTPAPRQSDEAELDGRHPDVNQDGAASPARASDQPAGAAGPTGEHPQVSEQQSQPHDDQQGTDEPPAHPFAPRPHPALTSDTQMVALGSRRPADALLGGANGSGRWNQGGFPPVETNGHHNGETAPRHGGAPVPGSPVPGNPVPGPRSPFAPGGETPPAGDDPLRSAFLPPGAEAPRPDGDDVAPGPRSPFAPPEDNGPAGAPFAPSPFAPQAGAAAVTSPEPPAPPLAPPPPVARPSAAGSAQVPVPMGGRPVSGPPASAAAAVPSAPHGDVLAPTRLEPTGWATAGPRPAASGSATVPVSAPAGRRSRDEQADEEHAPAVPDEAAAPRAGEAPKRPGDVGDIAITFWSEAASEHYRADWHEVKAQFVDDPVAALTRAHDLLTEAVHELTESMLAERDELDPLRGTAKPDTESMRMAMRGYREFMDRILAL